MQNWVKIGHMVLEISHCFDFQDGLCLPSWTFKFSNSWSPIRVRELICIVEPNFIKTGQTLRDVTFNIFQTSDVRHLAFLKILFLNSWYAPRTNMCHHAKFYHNGPNDSDFCLFSRWPPSAILDFHF